MKLTLCLLIAAYLAVDLCLWHGPADRALESWLNSQKKAAARVGGFVITGEDVDHAAQEIAFRQGADWKVMSEEARAEARRHTLARLVEGASIRAARLRESAPAADASEELRLFILQFPEQSDYTERLPWQHLTETQLKAGMQAALEDQAWIEKKIALRLASITEDKAREWYAAHQEEIKVPEAFHAIHLLLSDHAKDPRDDPDRQPEIRTVYQQIKTGSTSLEALAGSLSDDERSKKTSGDLGWFTRPRMPADFMAEIDKLSPGETSQPVHTHLGWHIIKLLEKKPARVPAFEEVRAEILEKLRNAERVQAVKEMRQPGSPVTP